MDTAASLRTALQLIGHSQCYSGPNPGACTSKTVFLGDRHKGAIFAPLPTSHGVASTRLPRHAPVLRVRRDGPDIRCRQPGCRECPPGDSHIHTAKIGRFVWVYRWSGSLILFHRRAATLADERCAWRTVEVLTGGVPTGLPPAFAASPGPGRDRAESTRMPRRPALDQCLKWRVPVKTIATSRSSQARMVSASRFDPPG